MTERKPLEGLAECIKLSTAAQGVDYWAVEVYRLDIAEWASMTGRDRSSVARNIRRAREAIESEDSE
jgi:hypothetical protein